MLEEKQWKSQEKNEKIIVFSCSYHKIGNTHFS